jgi:ketosteroid isomerase-like protein
MKKIFLSLLLLQFVFLYTSAQLREIDSIQKINSEWVSSMIRKDTAGIKSLLADDIIFINPQGTRLGKKEILLMIADPGRKYKSIHIDKIADTKIVGTTGVIVFETSTFRMLDGVESFLKMSVMNIFEKRKGKWVIIASHNTLLEAR